MSTCKDCLHYEACKGTYYTAKGDEDILYEFDGEMYAHSGCEHFKPKADYVEVVRCKDCEYAKLDLMEKGLVVCRRPVLKNGQLLPFNWETKYTDFCSYGERKESEVQGEWEKQ